MPLQRADRERERSNLSDSGRRRFHFLMCFGRWSQSLSKWISRVNKKNRSGAIQSVLCAPSSRLCLVIRYFSLISSVSFSSLLLCALCLPENNLFSFFFFNKRGPGRQKKWRIKEKKKKTSEIHYCASVLVFLGVLGFTSCFFLCHRCLFFRGK